MKPVGARVQDDVFKALVERAKAEGVSVSEVVRRAVVAYLGKPVERPLEAKLRELEELEGRVSRLESEVTALRRAVEKLSTAGASGGTKQAQARANPTAEGKRFLGKYVYALTFEELEKKGLNAESYMKSKERQGYICNDTASHVICVWREELEQAVVDLNNAKARMGELDKVLSGVRLEVAKAAEKAGLLWFDAREGRWRIHR